MMQESIKDKSSEAFQRLAWEALKKSINGLINKVGNSLFLALKLFVSLEDFYHSLVAV